MDGNGNNHDGSAALARGVSNLSNDGGAEKDMMQCVQVAVHIRPLINHERLQGCKECITVIPGEPQVQIGTHSFTFDHVYGSTGSPSSAIFEECVAPLVDGLFQGYNATVLAYGQTGSGKTYTMGTAYTVGGNTEGVIPKVMEAIFKKVGELKHQGEVLLKVSFIEILKEEIHDLLEANHSKGPIQIREKTNGGITITNAEEVDVSSQEEMADVLAQGSLCRATGSTNMNQQSSRSHAIFTINMVNKRKSEVAVLMGGDSGSSEEQYEEIVCAKLHLVDLAGSERAKRTGADGLRFKEGVHINKGLLALGNVISALGDDKKRKEGSHVPYRDSKLTRLLQDSLGGNSRTVMIACVSPADTNAEETLNTLKYANRARNIQNKAIVNRNPMAAEMQRMRHQLEYLQAELLCSRNGASLSDELQVLNHKISRLEASNAELRQELEECRLNSQILADRAMEAQVEKDQLSFKIEQLRNGKTWKEIDDADQSQDVNLIKSYLSKIQDLENEVQHLQAATNIQSTGTIRPSSLVGCLDIEDSALEPSHEVLGGEESREGEEEEETAKELEHSYLQDTMGKELQELDKRLEQKEAEMKMFAKGDTTVLRQHFEKKFMELEEEKKALLKEMERLKAELESISNTSDEHTQKMQESYIQKLKALETQISELKKRQENQAQLLKQKQKSDEAAKRLQEEIQRIKTHRVQLQHKMKQESEQFRFWKASREKELLQLKKEGRRNEYEMHKLQALHQRQKMVLQRKTEEAAMVTKRLKEILEARKVSSRDATGGASGSGQTNGKALQHSIEQELEVVVRVHEVRSEYEKQTQSRAEMAKELAKLQQANESGGTPSASPRAREARMKVLEEMLNNSSAVLVNMASQLSEAEERERTFIGGRGRWNQLRSMGDAKVLLSYLFNMAASLRCQLQDKELETREMKINLHKLSSALRQSDAQREELEKKLRSKEQVSLGTHKHPNNLNFVSSQPEGHFASKQPQNQASVVDISNTWNESFPYDLRKASRISQMYSFPPIDEIDMLEQEDMDTSSDDQSDDEDVDWAEDLEEEHATMKKNKVFMGPKGSKPLDRKSSGSVGSDLQDNGSLGRSQGDTVCGENEIKSKSDAEGCCTCSRVSGCKTMKCGCKAAGSFCGPRCGCKLNKCANRENMEMEVEPLTMNDMEVAESVEILGVSKVQQQNHGKDEIKRADNNIGDGLTETKALAVHGASLLENALKESLSRQEVHADSNRDQEVAQEQNVGHRKPLTDIGNTNVASQDQANSRANQRKKWKKPQIQIVEVAPQSNAQVKDTMATTNTKLDTPATSLASNTSLSARPVSHAAEEASNTSVQESTIPLKLPRSMHKGASAMTSPLKTRNTSASEESGGTANGPGSPGKCGRGMNGKENLRSK